MVVVDREILEVELQALQREFPRVAPGRGLDRQETAPLSVEQEQQSVEVDQAVFIECLVAGGGVRDLILRAGRETVGKVCDDGEDALTKVFFELRLRAQGLFADVVKPAFALGIGLECGRRKERIEGAKILERLDRGLEVERKKFTGLYGAD